MEALASEIELVKGVNGALPMPALSQP